MYYHARLFSPLFANIMEASAPSPPLVLMAVPLGTSMLAQLSARVYSMSPSLPMQKIYSEGNSL